MQGSKLEKLKKESDRKKQEGEEGIQKLKELKHEVEKYRPDLIINKVPKGELKLFKELAKEEFGGDYGMTLKFILLHFIDDIKTTDNTLRIQRLEDLLFDLSEDDDKLITSLDGTIIGIDKK